MSKSTNNYGMAILAGALLNPYEAIIGMLDETAPRKASDLAAELPTVRRRVIDETLRKLVENGDAAVAEDGAGYVRRLAECDWRPSESVPEDYYSL